MDIHFGCTQCGKCCRNTKIPLTVSEAISWLNRGHEVQVLCEASPWSAALDTDPRALHFKRRSFAVMSGSKPARVVVMLVANVVGACPNLLSNMRCGIYEDRPLVCRIYPAEINPFIALKSQNKACPPEAWAADQPLLQREEVLMDDGMSRDIEKLRSADARDADLKHRMCVALNVVDAGLVHEAVLVYSPSAATLLSALTIASASGPPQDAADQWRFASDRPEIIARLANSGAIAIHLNDARSTAFQHLNFKREAIFDPNAALECLPVADRFD